MAMRRPRSGGVIEFAGWYLWGGDHESNKGAAFCCAMGRASGRSAPRAGDSSSQCSKGMGGGNRAATCRAASPATKCTAQTPPRALEGRGSARSRPRVALWEGMQAFAWS